MGPEGHEQKVLPVEGAPLRVVIEGVTPEFDGGQFPIKRTVGEDVVVSADIVAEGHDLLSAVVKYRVSGDAEWSESPMVPVVNDRWTGRFIVDTLGRYEYTIEAWVDHFRSWLRELSKKTDAGQDVASELLEGAEQVRKAAGRARGSEADWLREQARALQRWDRSGPAHPGGARAPTRVDHGPPSRPDGLSDLRTHAGRGRRTRAGPVRGLVRDVPPLGLRPSPAGTGRSRTSRRGSLTSPGWISTSSTCPRSTRSDGASARGPITP